MMWLVTGGRGYTDVETIERVLNNLLMDCPNRVGHLINGQAPGVDTIARAWAVKRGIQPVDCPALWDYYPHKGPKNAGSRRNTAMLQLNPDWVIAFPGAHGTADMVSKVREHLGRQAGMPSVRPYKLIEVKEDGSHREFSPFW